MANVIDPAGMSPEQFQELREAYVSQDQQPIDPPQEEVPAEPTVEAPPTIHLDGRDWTPDELRASLLRQDDYTRKTQEVADQRKELEGLIQLREAWQNPAFRPALLAEMAKEAGIELPVQGQPNVGTPQVGLFGNYNQSDSTPEWDQRGYGSHSEMLIHQQQLQQIATLSQGMQKFEQYIGNQTQAQRRELEAEQAAQSITTKYGLTGVTKELVKDSMTATGLEDPEAAFLKANADRLFKAARGQVTPKSEVPNSPPPDTMGRTFDPKLHSAGERMILMEQGYVPKEG